MLSHPNLTIELSEYTEDEKALLEEYWNCDINGAFPVTLKDLSKRFNLRNHQIYRLADQKSEVYWTFENCECGNSIKVKLTKRTDLASCLNGHGAINKYRNILDFKKCSECNEKEEQQKIEKQFNDNQYFESTPFQNDFKSDRIDSLIKRLSPSEIKILYKIYDIKDFNLIKNSSEIFPVKAGEHKRFVWRTLYKLDNLNLISAEKTGAFINSIVFIDKVEYELNQMIGELETYIEETDIELAMLKVSDQSKDKYFTILEPETDIVLKAGHKYEFVSRVISDKNMLLRVINLDKETNNNTLERTDDNPFGDNSFDDAPF